MTTPRTKKPSVKRAPKAKAVEKVETSPAITPGYDLFSRATDPVKETEGVWGPYKVDGKEVAKVKVARDGSAEFYQLLLELLDEHREVLEAGKAINASPEAKALELQMSEKIDAIVFARTVLKDWEGFTYPDGTPMPYTEELGVKAYIHLKDLRMQVFQMARNIDLYKTNVLLKDAAELKKS